MSERKLKSWVAAGLIDQATADQICVYEAGHARPLALWGVVGIAALAIALGIISVVAANWDAIPGMARLAIHLALIGGAGAAIWAKGSELTETQPWAHEALVFILGILGLTFMGHLGQVYQTSSPLWQPIALWLALFAPLIMARGLGWLTAAMIITALAVAVWNYAILLDTGPARFSDMTIAVRSALAISAPVLLGGLAAYMRKASLRDGFWRRLEQLALAYGVGGASLLIALSAFEHWLQNSNAGPVFAGVGLMAATGLVAALITWFVRPTPSGRATAGILGGTALACVLGVVLSGSAEAAGLLFMVLWAGIAAAALFGGWRGVFQMAVGVIAIRLIVLSFELAGDLLTSGAGLIVSGLLILAIAWGALRISRRFAPDAQGKES